MTPLIDAETKRCRVCKQDKVLEDFHPNKSCAKGVVGTCRKCTRMRISKWYAENRSRRQETANTKNRSRKEQAVAFFGDKCFDCNRSYPPYVYQFHHLDPTQKDMNPSYAISKNPIKMWEELKKCVMLCANCHMIRHHKGKEGVDGSTH